MMRRIVIIDDGVVLGGTMNPTWSVQCWLERHDTTRLIGQLDCGKSPAGLIIRYAEVDERVRRQRVGHQMMFEAERRIPILRISDPTGPKSASNYSVPSWLALRDEILRTGNPFVGRPDLEEMFVPSCRRGSFVLPLRHDGTTRGGA